MESVRKGKLIDHWNVPTELEWKLTWIKADTNVIECL